MSILRYDDALQVLVSTRGHPFERDPFAAMLESLPGIATTQVEQPAAQAFFTPEAARGWDAFLLYDMPGIEFRPGAAPVFHPPPQALVDGMQALLARGHGLVFLHHALAGWPAWADYAEITGARFLYQPGDVRGEHLPDSGYRHGVKYRARVVAPEHPVTAGLGEGFEIEDELYLFRVFEDDVTPLLRSDFRFVDEEFYSAARALEGQMFSREGWSHPPGSDVVAWARHLGKSPIVCIVCGDGPAAYGNPGLRRLIANALHWVAGEARRRRDSHRGLDRSRS